MSAKDGQSNNYSPILLYPKLVTEKSKGMNFLRWSRTRKMFLFPNSWLKADDRCIAYLIMSFEHCSYLVFFCKLNIITLFFWALLSENPLDLECYRGDVIYQYFLLFSPFLYSTWIAIHLARYFWSPSKCSRIWRNRLWALLLSLERWVELKILREWANELLRI